MVLRNTTVSRGRMTILGVLVLTLLALVCFQYLEVKHLRSTLYQRCLTRQAYDDASTELRRREVVAFSQLSRIEQTNQFVNQAIRDQRVALYSSLADAAQRAVEQQVPANCGIYR